MRALKRFIAGVLFCIFSLTSSVGSAATFVKTAMSNVTVFTGSGTFVVPTNVSLVFVSGVGGGGIGGDGASAVAGGSGGGSGRYVVNYPVAVTPGASITVTIGAAGAATTFGALLSLDFGQAGRLGAATMNVPGGAGGAIGGAGSSNGGGVAGQGGSGGGTPFGPGGQTGGAGAGSAASANSGGGGAGGGSTITTAGAGGTGYLLVAW